MRHIIGLDIVRIASATIVMLYHLTYFYPNQEGIAVPGSVWLSFGWVGVSVFFVVSGFVIAFSASEATPMRFLRSRTLRIMPGVVICGAITAGILLLQHTDFAKVIGLYVSTVLLSPTGPYVDGAYWTLAVEAQFYLIVFALLYAGRGKHLESLFSIMVITSAAMWAVRILGQLSPDLFAATRTPVEILDHFWLGLNGCFFGLGGMIWLAHYRGRTAWRGAMMAVSSVTGLAAVYAGARSISPQHWALPLIAVVIGVAGIFLSLEADTVLQRLSPNSQRFIRVAGLATYPLYLLHSSVGMAVITPLYQLDVSAWVSVLIGSLCVWALAVLVNSILEVVAGWLRRLWIVKEPKEIPGAMAEA